MKIRFWPILFLIFCVVFAGRFKAHSQTSTKPEIKNGDTDYLPEKFGLNIGGFIGRVGVLYNVLLKGETLEYKVICHISASPPKTYKKIRPTKKQWQDFWKAMDDAKLWQWRTRYDNHHILDGTHWSLNIEQRGERGHKIKSGGDNGYPLSVKFPQKIQSAEPTPVFKKYLAAVQALLGKEAFQ